MADPITNPSFETADATERLPAGWIATKTSSVERFAGFGDGFGYDNFERNWKLPASPVTPPFNQASLFELEPPNVAFALFSGIDSDEDFEDGWDNDEGLLDDFDAITSITAAFDTTPENFEDFEEDWKLPKSGGAPFNQASVFSWNDVTESAAMFDTGGESVEDFEEGWLDCENSIFTFAPTDIEATGFGTAVALGSYNWSTSAFTDGSAYTPPAYAVVTFADVTTAMGVSGNTLDIGYIDGNGVGGADGAVTIPATATVGVRVRVIEDPLATGVRDITSVTEQTPIGAQSGVVTFNGYAKDVEDFEDGWTSLL